MKISYEDLLYLFEQTENVDETRFYFCDDDENDEHYLGYRPEVGKVKPYWIGYCDIDGGCNFATAAELFEAKVFGGKSIKERWEHVIIVEIGGMCIKDFMKYFGGGKILSNRKRTDE